MQTRFDHSFNEHIHTHTTHQEDYDKTCEDQTLSARWVVRPTVRPTIRASDRPSDVRPSVCTIVRPSEGPTMINIHANQILGNQFCGLEKFNPEAFPLLWTYPIRCEPPEALKCPKIRFPTKRKCRPDLTTHSTYTYTLTRHTHLPCFTKSANFAFVPELLYYYVCSEQTVSWGDVSTFTLPLIAGDIFS